LSGQTGAKTTELAVVDAWEEVELLELDEEELLDDELEEAAGAVGVVGEKVEGAVAV
jgi:hypothetical protein